MSTSPLTLVVGEIRMPRLRPLELVSRSLGREWSLLPPNVSFRTELKALYAAMLRTFCLSSDAIRALCARYGVPYNSGSFSRQFGTTVWKIWRYALPTPFVAALSSSDSRRRR